MKSSLKTPNSFPLGCGGVPRPTGWRDRGRVRIPPQLLGDGEVTPAPFYSPLLAEAHQSCAAASSSTSRALNAAAAPSGHGRGAALTPGVSYCPSRDHPEPLCPVLLRDRVNKTAARTEKRMEL